jgi:hypothetical protein
VQLLDTGNLVLADDAGNPLWESFRNSSATDTLLPGQYFYKAANKTLTSWLTKDDPATGNGTYTFGWGIRANESILQLTWTSPKEFMNWTGGPYIPAPDVQSPPPSPTSTSSTSTPHSATSTSPASPPTPSSSQVITQCPISG